MFNLSVIWVAWLTNTRNPWVRFPVSRYGAVRYRLWWPPKRLLSCRLRWLHKRSITSLAYHLTCEGTPVQVVGPYALRSGLADVSQPRNMRTWRLFHPFMQHPFPWESHCNFQNAMFIVKAIPSRNLSPCADRYFREYFEAFPQINAQLLTRDGSLFFVLAHHLELQWMTLFLIFGGGEGGLYFRRWWSSRWVGGIPSRFQTDPKAF